MLSTMFEQKLLLLGISSKFTLGMSFIVRVIIYYKKTKVNKNIKSGEKSLHF